MEPNLNPEEWLRRNGTFWCPRLRLRARPGFCEEIRSRTTVSSLKKLNFGMGFEVEGTKPLRPAACQGCPGPEVLESSARRLQEILNAHSLAPEPPTPYELRRMRRRLGLSQGELAKKLRVSQQLVSMWEHGKIKVRGEYLEQLLELEKGA